MTNAFFDTSYICALYNSNDSQHKKAIQLKNKISKTTHPWISNYIFLETVTILSQKIGKKDSVDVGKLMFSSNKFNFLQITPKLNLKTWLLFQQIENKNISYVDCNTAILMKEEKISKLVTFDKDFEKIQKRLNYKFEIIP